MLDTIQSTALSCPPIKPRVICLMIESGSEAAYKSLKSVATYVMSLPTKGESNHKSLSPVEILQAIIAKVGQQQATEEQVRATITKHR